MRRKIKLLLKSSLDILPSVHNQKSEISNAKHVIYAKILLSIINVSSFLFCTKSGGGQAGQSLSMVLLCHAQFLKPTPELLELGVLEHDFAVSESSNWEAPQIFVRQTVWCLTAKTALARRIPVALTWPRSQRNKQEWTWATEALKKTYIWNKTRKVRPRAQQGEVTFHSECLKNSNISLWKTDMFYLLRSLTTRRIGSIWLQFLYTTPGRRQKKYRPVHLKAGKKRSVELGNF